MQLFPKNEKLLRSPILGPQGDGLMMQFMMIMTLLLSFFLKGCKKKMTKDDDGLQTVLKGHLVLQGAPSGGWH